MAAVGGAAGKRGVGSLLGVNISALATSAPDLTMMTPTELDAAFQDFARIEREAKRRKTEETERRNDECTKSKKPGIPLSFPFWIIISYLIFFLQNAQ